MFGDQEIPLKIEKIDDNGILLNIAASRGHTEVVKVILENIKLSMKSVELGIEYLTQLTSSVNPKDELGNRRKQILDLLQKYSEKDNL